MPLYEVVSGESTGTNGNSPKRKKVVAKGFDEAVQKAPVLYGGQIAKYSCYNYDEEEKRADYNVTTTKQRTFTVHVQEIWWLKIFKVFG